MIIQPTIFVISVLIIYVLNILDTLDILGTDIIKYEKLYEFGYYLYSLVGLGNFLMYGINWNKNL